MVLALEHQHLNFEIYYPFYLYHSQRLGRDYLPHPKRFRLFKKLLEYISYFSFLFHFLFSHFLLYFMGFILKKQNVSEIIIFLERRKFHMKLLQKRRKKGSLILEFLVVLPVLIFVAWACLQIMFFVNAQSTLHQAAMDAARITATELRGHVGPISSAPSFTQNTIRDQVQTKIHHVTKYNSLILLYRGENYEWLAPNAVPVYLDEGDCNTILAGVEARGICVETNTTITDPTTMVLGQDEEQVVVKIKAPFKLIGSFLPSLESLSAEGQGSAIKEASERHNYVPGLGGG